LYFQRSGFELANQKKQTRNKSFLAAGGAERDQAAGDQVSEFLGYAVVNGLSGTGEENRIVSVLL
jgi:hypothetical protein